MTKTDFLNDNDLSSQLSFDLGNTNYELLFIYRGGQYITYLFIVNGKELFFGNDYKPSPLQNIDSLESMVCLLGFLTVQEGDVDKEYFKEYTKNQLAYVKIYACEELKNYVSAFENEDDEFNSKAKEFFKKAYTN